jgi:prepilin-type N-terminal cleavage/methylation domain-containing protein
MRRAFTLLEIMVVLTILSLIGTVVSWNIKKSIDHHRFQSEISDLLIAWQSAQALAVTYKTDFALEFYMQNHHFYYRFSTDEPLSPTIFSQAPVLLKHTHQLTVDKKKLENQRFEIYSTGCVEPQGVIRFSSSEEMAFAIDLNKPGLLKLTSVST